VAANIISAVVSAVSLTSGLIQGFVAVALFAFFVAWFHYARLWLLLPSLRHWSILSDKGYREAKFWTVFNHNKRQSKAGCPRLRSLWVKKLPPREHVVSLPMYRHGNFASIVDLLNLFDELQAPKREQS
jgi:hypothetical protein